MERWPKGREGRLSVQANYRVGRGGVEFARCEKKTVRASHGERGSGSLRASVTSGPSAVCRRSGFGLRYDGKIAVRGRSVLWGTTV